LSIFFSFLFVFFSYVALYSAIDISILKKNFENDAIVVVVVVVVVVDL
jgi:hypothetical protein